MRDNHRPEPRNRRSIRLKGYDYAQEGAYFVTVCTRQQQCLFGSIRDGRMRLNDAGRAVRDCWNDLPRHYPHVKMDAMVVMPNHVHGIVVLLDAVGAGLKPAPTTRQGKRHALPEIVRGFKTFASRRVNQLRGTPGIPIWQRNYYEHVVRDDEDLDRIRTYIANNPARWDEDEDNPVNVYP